MSPWTSLIPPLAIRVAPPRGGGPGAKPPGKFGVLCNLGVGERGISDDFLKKKS